VVDLSKDENGEFADPIVEGAFQEFTHGTGKSGLEALAFVAGIDVDEAIRRIVRNAPERIVRDALSGLLLGLKDTGYHDLVMMTFKTMGEQGLREEGHNHG
jgi:hypothetical protein